jgi:signal transduction histidine kinase
VSVHAHLAPLWRGLVAYRVIALVAVVINLVRYSGEYARPVLAIVVVTAMAAWTVVTSVRYLRDGDGRTAIADLVVTSLATLSTLLIDTPERIAAGGPVATTMWSAGPVLALAVAYGWRGGAGGAVATTAVLLVVRRTVDRDLLYDAQLLLVAGLAVGIAADTMRRSAARLQAAIASEAATAERERLARDIHDGVLQVLALLRRRGEELALRAPDEPAAELARLAGEQEVALRRLITSAPVPTGVDGETDLSTVLAGVLPTRASLAVPAEPVPLAPATAEALAAVVREAATNATVHAGPDAGLWVLVEDAADAVTVSVRDDGPGIPAGRLDAAAAEGHLGVASSMRGRVAALGGTITLHTGPDEGTEWEIQLRRDR